MNSSDKSWMKISVIGILLGLGLLLFREQLIPFFSSALDLSEESITIGLVVAALVMILGGIAKIVGLVIWANGTKTKRR